MKLILKCLPFVFMITACSNDNYNDLNIWMKEQTIAQKGKIKPLPAAKTFIPISFKAKLDPFKERAIIALNSEINKYTPNPDRRKEPLETYGLESLKMVGSIIKDKKIYAIILAPDRTTNYVTMSNYMGSSYGKIIALTENQITLDERIKNSSDEWEPKKTIVLLEEN